ncbi:MAG: hypothetical protein KDD41_04615 [Flavobacteriales bacterium]|nr:hypothetical protein [Flavobacteriales bacterium]
MKQQIHLILLLCITVLGYSGGFSQNVTMYFSNTPFEMGKEADHPVKTDFTDADFIYGLAVVDQQSENTCDEEWQEVGGVKVSYFKGKSYGVKKITYSRVMINEGKAYIFFDILPELKHARSRDVKTWLEIVSEVPAGLKSKIIIDELMGNKCIAFDPLKVKKAVITLKKSKQISEERRNQSMLAYDQVNELRDQMNRKNYDDAADLRDEEDKKSGKLPAMFYKDDKWKNYWFHSEVSKEEFFKATQANKDCMNEGDQLLLIGHDYSETGYVESTKIVNYSMHHLVLVGKDKDGNCFYRKIKVVENYRNENYEEPGIIPVNKYTSGSKKGMIGTNYFSCDNLPQL